MLIIDGSLGEGGGQVLRTALGLSLVTGRSFRMERVRANRPRPGLQRQHLTALDAAAQIGLAEVTGNFLGSSTVGFSPQGIVPGKYRFAMGTAGSAALVLQTVLPALLSAGAPSELVLEGGTHNPMAPPFDFLESAFLPLLGRMGAKVEAKLERHGFYPAGGGRVRVRVEPAKDWTPLELLERGALRHKRGRVLLSNLPLHIAERECRVAAQTLGWDLGAIHIEPVLDPVGPGNAVLIELESECVTEVFTAFGERSVRAEQVAAKAAQEAKRYLEAAVPVGEHLADQLLLPMALARGGTIRTFAPTLHTRTNAEVIRMFLPVSISMDMESAVICRIEVKPL